MTYYRLKVNGHDRWDRYRTAEEATAVAQDIANSMRFSSIEVVKVIETCSTVTEMKLVPLYKPLWKDEVYSY